MDTQILIDFARYAHVLSVAVGFGGAFLADFHMLSRLGQPVDDDTLTTLHVCHKIVTGSLVAMWITGIVMIGIRTGFVVESFSPKLFSKLITVSILTANAILIARFAMPLVEKSRGRNLMNLSLATKLRLAVIGAVSTTSWLVAMAMGIIKVLATSGWLVFAILLPVSYAVSIAAAVGILVLLHLGGVLALRRPTALSFTVAMEDRRSPRLA